MQEALHYRGIGREFASHKKVFHGIGQYVNKGVTTNNIEGYFSIIKRGMRGIYQHYSGIWQNLTSAIAIAPRTGLMTLNEPTNC
ncbi:hypothetical protein CHN51_04030 [Sphingorhabdus sp. YGSMI21]|nr:hypothetical protein CHN51_04030 [Sphingorhabdus sp. YGSMI21]